MGGTHISVIRGEEPPDKTAWKTFDGQRVEVRYAWAVTETKEYLWLPVVCSPANVIRVELGLPADSTPAMHLTFGNTKGGRAAHLTPSNSPSRFDCG